jgi:molecular chaperone Hsp33
MAGRTQSPLGAITLAGDDKVVPFQVAPLDIRGRSVQLGPMLNAILERHDYPNPVAALLGEAIVLTVLLGTSLKFEGKFIVQTQSDGPVGLLVVDFRTPDSIRAYARFDKAGVSESIAAGRSRPADLLGSGILAMTIDQGVNTQRYQGIVELNGISLEQAAMQYFRQSEQIPTVVRLAAAEILTPATGTGFTHAWRAGGLVAQFLPEASDRIRMADLPGGDAPEGAGTLVSFAEDEAWVEAKALVETISDDELTDPQIGAERLLFRLFNEHGVLVFGSMPVEDKCSCSREKIAEIIRNFSKEEQAEAMEDGLITTTCEFCSTVYRLSEEDLG